MGSLEECGRACGTDKVGHGYLTIYEAFFSKFPEDGTRILEIGVQEGKSLTMWKTWRPGWKVLGVDCDPKARPDYLGDQSDIAFMSSVVGDMVKPHIVVDDGGHKGKAQIASLYALWPHLAHGGLYCIEDLHTAYDPADGCEFRDWLMTTVDTVNGRGDPAIGIRAVHLFKSLAVLVKV